MAYSGAGRPLSIKELSERAMQFEWNPNVGFKYWARAAETIWHEAQVAFREEDMATAYIFLMRYSLLVVQHLRSHPEAKTPEAKRAMKPLVDRVRVVLEILEQMRPQLERSYKEWEALRTSARERSGSQSRQRSSSQSSTRARKGSVSGWGGSKVLDPVEHKDLAVELAKKEMSRRKKLPGLSAEEVSRRRTAGIWSLPKPAPSPSFQEMPDEELRKQMEATRRQLDRNHNIHEDETHDRGSDHVRVGSYNYPPINKSSNFQYAPTPPPSQPGARSQPPRPPKESLDQSWPAVIPSAPPLPEKPLAYEALPPPPPPYSPKPDLETPPIPPKHAAGTVKEKRTTFKPIKLLENGTPIRPVFLPATLRTKFLQLAADNTRRKVEMCGLLCGTTVNGGIFVTTLLIPEQICTPDTCETQNEEATLEYCVANDIYQIGWIHTHPTQSCFMSSRDIHTHAYYQTSFPEAIAIVCAPRHGEFGTFRLTNPPGLEHILACNDRQAFHPHSIDNIYTTADHVIETNDLDYEVYDLRPKH
ncbi:hypothetical protein OQA88_8119 [Cercophora sp. LCS_1]